MLKDSRIPLFFQMDNFGSLDVRKSFIVPPTGKQETYQENMRMSWESKLEPPGMPSEIMPEKWYH